MREVSTVGDEFPFIGRTADATRRFGHELKRGRRNAGLTQRELAERVRYSREMVAAVERGRRYGSRELAVRCDEVLGTGGVLARLWPLVEREQVAADRRRGPRPERPGRPRRKPEGREGGAERPETPALGGHATGPLGPVVRPLATPVRAAADLGVPAPDPAPDADAVVVTMDRLREIITDVMVAQGQ
jgi:transcriptional regulator with XRE-family HTH domain